MSLFVAGAVLGEGQVSLFVAGAVLGEGQVSLFVAGAVLGEGPVSLFVAGAVLGEGPVKPVPWHLGVSNLFGCLKVFGFGNKALLFS